MNHPFSWETLYYCLAHQMNHLGKQLTVVNQENIQLEETLHHHLKEQQQLLNALNEHQNQDQNQNQIDSDHESSKSEDRKRTKAIIKRKPGSQQNRRSNTFHNCPYENCDRTYKSGIAMNLHIKINHNGGTKKQRQAYAKQVIAAEEGQCEPPKEQLNLPENFLNEFRRNYNYKKKYNM